MMHAFNKKEYIIGSDVEEAADYCVRPGQDGGGEAAIHAMRTILTEAVLMQIKFTQSQHLPFASPDVDKHLLSPSKTVHKGNDEIASTTQFGNGHVCLRH